MDRNTFLEKATGLAVDSPEAKALLDNYDWSNTPAYPYCVLSAGREFIIHGVYEVGEATDIVIVDDAFAASLADVVTANIPQRRWDSESVERYESPKVNWDLPTREETLEAVKTFIDEQPTNPDDDVWLLVYSKDGLETVWASQLDEYPTMDVSNMSDWTGKDFHIHGDVYRVLEVSAAPDYAWEPEDAVVMAAECMKRLKE